MATTDQFEQQCRSVIGDALKAAQLAVAEDLKLEYRSALQNYEKAIELLQSDILHHIDLIKTKRMDLIEKYRDRMDILMSFIPDKDKQDTYSISTEAKQLQQQLELPPSAARFLVERSPNQDVKKPFWIMRLLHTSIQTGGYITPNLFIPKEVWTFESAEYQSQEIQDAAFDSIIIWFQKIKQLDMTDINALLEEILMFEENMMLIQVQLSRKFKFIPEPVKFKQDSNPAGGNLGEKYVTVQEHLKILSKLFQEAQFLDDWVSHFQLLPPTESVKMIQQSLVNICNFLNITVCKIVISDFKLHLQNYIKANQENYINY